MNKKFSTKDLVLVAMMTAIVSVLSILQIPGPGGVPWTLQVFAVALSGYVLGWKLGTLSVVIYILLGTVGVPVFAGMTGGPGSFVSPSGGFIIGFIAIPLLGGLFVSKKFPNVIVKGIILAVFCILGDCVCEFLGAVTMHQYVEGMSFSAALKACFVGFFPIDCLKIILADVVAFPIRRGLEKANLFHY